MKIDEGKVGYAQGFLKRWIEQAIEDNMPNAELALQHFNVLDEAIDEAGPFVRKIRSLVNTTI